MILSELQSALIPLLLLLSFFFYFLIPHSDSLKFCPLQSHTAKTWTHALLQPWLGFTLKSGSVFSLGQLSLLQGCAGWIQLLVPAGLKHPLLPAAPSSQPGCAQRHIHAAPRTCFTTTGQDWPRTSCCYQSTRTVSWRSQHFEIYLRAKEHTQPWGRQGAGNVGESQGTNRLIPQTQRDLSLLPGDSTNILQSVAKGSANKDDLK